MKPYQDRVVEEKRELDAKRDNLRAFLATDACACLPTREQMRLKQQFWVMTQYSEILGQRIEAFGKEEP